MDTSLLVNMAINAANGIAHLHSKNIIHRDIKPGNFLVDEHFHVYVIDFGVSRVSTADPTEKMTLIGTPSYMAPEVLDGQPYDGKADTYSFVLVLWSMVRVCHCVRRADVAADGRGAVCGRRLAEHRRRGGQPQPAPSHSARHRRDARQAHHRWYAW